MCRCGLSILGSFIVFGTVVDIINKYNSKKDLSLIEKVLKCFSLHENGTKVLSTKVGGADHITCLGGIRYDIFNRSLYNRYLKHVECGNKHNSNQFSDKYL